MNNLKIKKGDTVRVLSGKDKGKTGKVLQVLPKTAKIMVENVALHTRFQKSKQANQLGKKIVFSVPIPVSKVMLMDANSGQPSRVGYKILENKTKQRIAKKSGKAI
jgi:large subunit ribosomal protein L24